MVPTDTSRDCGICVGWRPDFSEIYLKPWASQAETWHCQCCWAGHAVYGIIKLVCLQPVDSPPLAAFPRPQGGWVLTISPCRSGSSRICRIFKVCECADHSMCLAVGRFPQGRLWSVGLRKCLLVSFDVASGAWWILRGWMLIAWMFGVTTDMSRDDNIRVGMGPSSLGDLYESSMGFAGDTSHRLSALLG